MPRHLAAQGTEPSPGGLGQETAGRKGFIQGLDIMPGFNSIEFLDYFISPHKKKP